MCALPAGKDHRHTCLAVKFISMPVDRFNHVHIDVVGPLLPSGGCAYLLTMVDRYTWWPEAVPVPDVQMAMLARAFLYNWVTRFGVPRLLTSDQGAQFKTTMWGPCCPPWI